MDIFVIPIILIVTSALLYQCWKKEKSKIFFVLLLFSFMMLGGWIPAIIDSQKEVLLPDGGSEKLVLAGFTVGAVIAILVFQSIKNKLFKSNITS